MSSRSQRRGNDWSSQRLASSQTASATARGRNAVSNSMSGTRFMIPFPSQHRCDTAPRLLCQNNNARRHRMLFRVSGWSRQARVIADANGVFVDDILVGLSVTGSVVHVPAEQLEKRVEEFAAELGFVVRGGLGGIELLLETLDLNEYFCRGGT